MLLSYDKTDAPTTCRLQVLTLTNCTVYLTDPLQNHRRWCSALRVGASEWVLSAIRCLKRSE